MPRKFLIVEILHSGRLHTIASSTTRSGAKFRASIESQQRAIAGTAYSSELYKLYADPNEVNADTAENLCFYPAW